MHNNNMTQDPCSTPNELDGPHGALFLVLGYLRLRELLAFQSGCRLFRDAIADDGLLWRKITVDLPLSSRLTDGALLGITSRAEGRLKSLALLDCCKITDDGLLQVVERNPGITKLYVPGCTHLTPEGMVRVVKLLHERKGRLNELRLRGLCNIKKDHLEILNSLICKGKQSEAPKQLSFYGFDRSSVSFNGHDDDDDDEGRPIDVDMCPMCGNVRLVFDCTRDTCRKMEERWAECRGCYYCIARCEDCGGCIDPVHESQNESACNHLLCTQCWLKLPKCDTCNRPYCTGHRTFAGPATGFVCQQCADGDVSHFVTETGY